MKKTTVYLPDELKAALERAAAATGESEAALIRRGVERVVATEMPPRPVLPLFSRGDGGVADRVDELLAEGFGRD